MPTVVIDCHTHAYPLEISTDARSWALKHRESHWSKLVAPLGRSSIHDWADPERMLADMDDAGVDQAVLLGWYWEHTSTCRWHNKIIADWVAVAPDRFIGFAAIHPAQEVKEQLEFAAEGGLRGVGELHHGVQNFNAKSEGWHELTEWCAGHNWPINLHVTGTIGRQHPDAIATPHHEIIALAQTKPEVKIVLAHWGGDLLLQAKTKAALKLPENVYYDCSASPLLHSADVFKEALRVVGPDKLLFGSDYPLRLFPRDQAQADFAHYLDYIKRESGLDTVTLDALLGENFQRLLN